MPSPIGHLEARPLEVDQARLLEAASPVPVLVVDVHEDGYCVLAISPVLRRFVTGARHPAGPVPTERIPAAGFGVLADILAAATTGPEPQPTMELPVGDDPTWYEVRATPVVVDDAVAQVMLLATDRTSERDLEQRQHRARHRFEAMVNHAPGLVMLVDSTGRIVFTSPTVEPLLGVRPEELAGRPIFEMLHPDTLARSASVFNQVLSSPGLAVPLSDFRFNQSGGGVLWCEGIATNLLHDDDVAAIVINAYDVTDRRVAEERLELLATSDALTGLPNRRRLEARLEDAFTRATRSGLPVGLALVDIDDFKLVNDALGHEVGDQVLRAIANRLERTLGERGFVARIGGDEFAMVLEAVETPDELLRLSDAVHEMLRAPVAVGEHDVYVRASIGTTTGHPSSADARTSLRSADLALYRAKRNGRNQTVRFTAELQLQAEERLDTISTLQRALRDGRLRLAYQPVVDTRGAVVGAEGLLRWEHDGQLIRPADFLALAEDTGLILPMGTWVLDQACQDLRELRSALPGFGWVSVNLSSRQILDERLPLVIASTLRNHGIGTGGLAVEVSDRTLRDHPDAECVLGQLAGVEVMLALTDVAHDQSGLHRLDRLGVDTVKLDQAFTQALDHDPGAELESLALGIIHLAQESGVGVIAEGVETAVEAEVLARVGCTMFQGFHYSEPLDLASLIIWARSSA